MPRRVLALIALVGTFVLIACQGAPAAPALSDPKEILSQSIASLANVKTISVNGSFTGNVKAAELGGNFDLSSIKLTAALDAANKKARFSIDAPTLMGTKIDALVIDKVAYFKIAGPFAAMAGATADKYTKTDIPEGSAAPVTNPGDVAKAVAEIKAGLEKLPAPTKGANEKCGDQDCYHVTMKVTAADIQKLDSTAASVAGTGDATLDIWSRTNDLRPAKLGLSVATPDQGTFGATFDFTYDTQVSVDAPPADQIAP
jgi:hypothetical protein